MTHTKRIALPKPVSVTLVDQSGQPFTAVDAYPVGCWRVHRPHYESAPFAGRGSEAGRWDVSHANGMRLASCHGRTAALLVARHFDRVCGSDMDRVEALWKMAHTRAGYLGWPYDVDGDVLAVLQSIVVDDNATP